MLKMRTNKYSGITLEYARSIFDLVKVTLTQLGEHAGSRKFITQNKEWTSTP